MVAGSSVLPNRLIAPALAQAKPKGDQAAELNASKVALLESVKEKSREVAPVEGDFWPLPPVESPVADTSARTELPDDGGSAPTTTTSVATPAGREGGSNTPRKRDKSGDRTQGSSNASDRAEAKRAGESGAAFSPIVVKDKTGKVLSAGRAATLIDSPEPKDDGKADSSDRASASERKVGFDAGSSKEARKEAASVIYDNADGSQTAVVYGSDVNVADETGKLAPIDTNLAESADGRMRPKRAKVAVELARSADDPELISIADQGVELSLSLVGASGAEAVLDGDTATYVEAVEGIDLLEQVLPGGVKETIVVKAITPALGADAAVAKVSFAATGASLEPQADGSIAVTGPAGRVGTIPAPSATTADGTPIKSDGLSYEVTSDATAGSTVLAVVINREWLASQALPLLIYPTYVSVLTGASDTFVQGGIFANSNFGATSILHTGYWCQMLPFDNYCQEPAASLWRPADISSFVGSHVLRACARFRIHDLAEEPELGGPRIALASPQWDANTVTWNTGPGFLSPSAAEHLNLPIGTGTCQKPGPEWVVFDVTEMVRALASGAIPNNGFRLWDESYFSYSSGYDSQEAPIGQIPHLQVDFNSPPAPAVMLAPADDSVIVDDTPTLTVANSFSDPDNELSYIDVWYRVSTGSDCSSGNFVASSGWLPATTNSSWTVSQGSLVDGVTYTWCALTWDGSTVVAPNKGFSFRYTKRLGTSQPSPFQQVGPVAVNAATGNMVVAGSTRQIPTVGGNLGINLTYNSQEEKRGLRGVYTGAGGSFVRLTNVGYDTGLLEVNGPNVWTCSATRSATWRGLLTVPTSGQWQLGILVTNGQPTSAIADLELNGSSQSQLAVTAGTTLWGPAATMSAASPARLVAKLSMTGGAPCTQVAQLLIRQNGGPSQTLPLDWLTPELENTPPRWALVPESSGTGFTRASRTGDNVVLTDYDGAAHSYTKRQVVYPAIVDGDGNLQCSLAYSVYLGANTCQGPSSAYYPASGEQIRAVIVDGPGGELVATTEDGFTTTFNSSGAVQSASSGADDRSPGGHLLTYIPAPNWEADHEALLRKVEDPVSGQSLTLSYYAVPGDSCSTPAGASAPAVPLVCKVTQADGSVTQFIYNSAGQLTRILAPGTSATDFGYGANGRISTIRTPEAVDALVTGSFVGSAATVNTDIAYDTSSLPRVSSITSPAPVPGATRLVTSFSYGSSSTTITLPGGVGSRVVGFDAALRQTTDTDPSGTTATATWRKFDQPATTTDPKGRVTTLTYDDGIEGRRPGRRRGSSATPASWPTGQP